MGRIHGAAVQEEERSCVNTGGGIAPCRNGNQAATAKQGMSSMGLIRKTRDLVSECCVYSAR